ncbi:hypothetical protein JCM14036_09930 [Desulfotomaculum defluvii]
MGNRKQIRIHRMGMSTINVAVQHNKSPWLSAWWSAALPGLGHLCLGNYFKGLTLMSWEMLLNFKAKINLGILYTFVGEFQKAKEVIQLNWAIFYGVVFCFAIFDAYKTCVEYNTLSFLEKKQKRHYIKFFNLSPYGVNYLSRYNPWSSLIWSALLTGFGHLYTSKALKGIILFGWMVAIIIFSKINHAIIYTLIGEFERVNKVLDYQWLLFFPSIYVFAMWDSYNDAVEMNKLYTDDVKNRLTKIALE